MGDSWDQIGYGSSGGGSKATKPRSTPKTSRVSNRASGSAVPEKQLLRLLGRIKNTESQGYGHVKPLLDQAVSVALKGYKPKDFARLARAAGVSGATVTGLKNQLAQQQSSGDFVSDFLENDVSHAVDYLGRPANAVAGGLVEGGGNPFSGKTWEGAWKGASAEKRYSPTQGVLRIGGLTSKKEAKKIEKSLPGPVRFTSNLVAGAALDPTTYLTLGTTAVAKGAAGVAAETAAAIRLGDQAANVASKASTAASILKDIRRVGINKALSKDELAAVAAVSKKLPRNANAFQGGARFAGHHIPGTTIPRTITEPLKQQAWAKILDQAAEKPGWAKTLVMSERAGSNRAGLRQLERAGRAGTGSADRMENLVAEYLSHRTRSELRANTLVKAVEDVSDEELHGPIFQALEGGYGAIRHLEPRLRKVAMELDKVRRTDYQTLVDAGRLSPRPEGQLEDIGRVLPPSKHLARYETPEAAVEAGRAAKAGLGNHPNPFTGQTMGTLKGRIPETRFTPSETIMAPAAPLKGVDTEAQRVVQKFGDNPVASLTRQGAEIDRDVARMKFTEGLAKITDDTGMPLVRPWDDSLTRAGFDEVKLPTRQVMEDGTTVTQTESLAVPKEMTQDFRRVIHVMHDDAALAHITRGMDKWMNLWKGYATVPLPFGSAFVLRNMEGNFWNGAILLGTHPGDWVKATKVQRAMWKGSREGDIYKYLDPQARQYVDEAINANVIDSGFYEADMDEAFDLAKTGKSGSKWNPVSPNFGPIEYGRRFNSAVERNARFAAFIGQRGKGLPAETAGHLVRKYLFDYGDLTDLDRSIKKFVPFWTFTRKNIPLQLEHLIKQPGKYAALMHFRDAAMRESQNYDPTAMPDYISQDGGFVLPDLGLGKTPLAIDSQLPATQALDTLRPLGELPDVIRGKPDALSKFAADAINASGIGGPIVTPGGGLKTLMELALGKEAFSGRPFGRGEQVATPSWLGGGWLTDGNIPREWQYLLENQLPVLNKIRGIVPTDKADQPKQIRRLISLITGQQVTPLNDQTRSGELYRRLDEIRRIEAELEQEGITLPDLPIRRTSKSGSRRSGSDSWDQLGLG